VSQAHRNQRNELSLNLGALMNKVFGKGGDASDAGTRWASAPFTVRGLETRP
jgi:hypothetical protein